MGDVSSTVAAAAYWEYVALTQRTDRSDPRGRNCMKVVQILGSLGTTTLKGCCCISFVDPSGGFSLTVCP